MRKFKDCLGKELLFFDGAMGTMLQKSGLKSGELPENLNLTAPAQIEAIHKAYLAAGANIIKSNTFGANGLKYENPAEVIQAGLAIARRAAAPYDAWVALDLGPTGKLLKPLGELAFEDAYALYREQILTGKDMADLILLETMGDLYEIKAALLAAKENCDLPVVVTMIFGDNGRLLTGADVQTAALTIEGLGADAIGFNCGFGPEQMLPLTEELARVTSLPIVINPNAGLPEVINGSTVYNVSETEFAEKMAELVSLGASAVGGCCGTTPDYIRAEVSACKNIPLVHRAVAPVTAVTSYAKTVVFDKKTVLIGERINPTGKKRFKEALRAKDMNYILNEGIVQAENGADILDVNVGLPEIDEAEMLLQAVQSLQAVTDLPLQLDTSDTAALERALRVYNGKPMINSASGKAESMRAVFPLAKKYGGVVVCLLLDEDGIPDTAEGRLCIAEKMIQTAAEYGIAKKDLIFDALAMTVSTDPRAALVTLETIAMLTKRLQVKTVLGVSNISFGLPRREVITSEFFLLAMYNGLSAGIINPNSSRLLDAYRAYNALNGLDPSCEAYIAAAQIDTVNTPAVTLASTDKTIYDCILKGLKEEAAVLAAQALESRSPFDIIDRDIIAALNTAGKGFEEKTLFLPQLLSCAQAAKQVFDVIKSRMPKTTGAGKGRIVIATVKNDIHDIGKNIVRTLLENYGFDVLDLGKDVAPELIVDTVKKEQIRLVGLSALMTTTVPSMEETIRLLHREAPDCKIMVGGAVLTQKYADAIGADFYGKDAMESVRYAQKIFSDGNS